MAAKSSTHNLLLLILTLYISSSHGDDYIASEFQTNAMFGNRVEVSFVAVLGVWPSRSLVECAGHCARVAACRAVVRTSGDRLCKLYDHVADDVGEVYPADGARYLERYSYTQTYPSSLEATSMSSATAAVNSTNIPSTEVGSTPPATSEPTTIQQVVTSTFSETIEPTTVEVTTAEPTTAKVTTAEATTVEVTTAVSSSTSAPTTTEALVPFQVRNNKLCQTYYLTAVRVLKCR